MFPKIIFLVFSIFKSYFFVHHWLSIVREGYMYVKME